MKYTFQNSIFHISFVLLVAGQSVKCANILFTCVMGSLSHHIALHPLAVRLVENGHTVTYLSSVELKNTHSKIKYFLPTALVESLSKLMSSFGEESLRSANTPNVFTVGYPLVIQMCKVLYESEEIQNWIRKSQFDLLVYDAGYGECALGLAYKFNVPYIGFNPASLYPWQFDIFGIPIESSWIPDLRLNYTQDMGFPQRVVNTLSTLHMHFFHMSTNYYPALTEIIRIGLKDPNVPAVPELLKNMSLLFVNSYFAAEYARSLPPFVIPVGGLHCSTANQTLVPELDEFISKFYNAGFIFISFGTAFKLSDKSMNAMVHVMSTRFQEIGFIFRLSGDIPETRHENVKFVSWAPQQLLLDHPRIRAFVTQCGMASTNEAVHYGVPVLAIPGFGDQDFNAECLVRLGVANRLELTDLNEQNLEAAIREILFNEKLRKKMKAISDVYRDRPQPPLETALWWTEYVLRHSKKGSDLALLRPLGRDQFWFQRRLIDVYFFVFIILLLLAFIFVKSIIAFKNLLKGIFTKPKHAKLSKKGDKTKTS